VASRDRCGSGFRVWDLETGQSTRFDCRSQTSALAVSPAENTLAIGLYRGDVLVRAVPDGQERPIRTEATYGEIRALAFSPDGSLLAVAPSAGVELWDLVSREPVVQFAPTPRSVVRGLAFSPDGKFLAVTDHRSEVLMWDIAGGRGHTVAIPGMRWAHAVAFAPDGRTLAVLDNWGDAGVVLWDLSDHRARTTIPGRARDLAISPDGRVLATVGGGNDGLYLYAVEDGRRLGSYCWHIFTVNTVAFSPDGNWLVTASDDRFVKLWPMAALLRT
jgi:WD40 repeat protein